MHVVHKGTAPVIRSCNKLIFAVWHFYYRISGRGRRLLRGSHCTFRRRVISPFSYL
jgi:hypothetical protein